MTDANGTVTSMIYDALNRVTNKSYTLASGVATTPSVTYQYDQDTIGTLYSAITNTCTTGNPSICNGTTYAHDKLGRVTGNTQTTAGQTYKFGSGSSQGYSYDLMDDVTGVYYPTGRHVQYTIDSATNQVRKVNDASNTYASGITYTGPGGLLSMTLGNGLTENFTVNDRLQTNNIAVKNSSSSLLSLWLYPCPGSSVGPCTNNNGNILSQTIWAPAFANTLIQNYTYDNLNRITQAAETANSATNWSQTFGYDIYGNRTITARSSNLTVSPWEPSTFSATNNRITDSGWVYDSDGNIKQSPGGQTITYDAENHQATFCAGSGGTNCTGYVYDGEGRRVGKINPGASAPTEIYVYMQDGQLAAEYDTTPPSLPCSTCYLFADHLGTTRLITDANGTYVERHDFLPFGEEIIVGGSTDPRYGAGYASGSTWLTQKYTGAERDYESQLDFLQARYLASMQGRFLSPDPFNAGAQIGDPQTWNGYAYVGNNPLRYTDLTGKCFFCVLDDVIIDVFKVVGTVELFGLTGGLAPFFGGTAAMLGGAPFVFSLPALEASATVAAGDFFGAKSLGIDPMGTLGLGGGGVGPWSEQLPAGLSSTTLGARVGVSTGTWGNSSGPVDQNFSAAAAPFPALVPLLEELGVTISATTVGIIGIVASVIFQDGSTPSQRRSQAAQQRDESWAKDQARRICGQLPSREAQRRAWEDASKHGMPRGTRDKNDLLNDLLDTMRAMGECRGR